TMETRPTGAEGMPGDGQGPTYGWIPVPAFTRTSCAGNDTGRSICGSWPAGFALSYGGLHTPYSAVG
ncbi:MAG TPA: hypothetical protein VN415_09455, partial [Dehalococcoidia bacterium]|nr:hypothetical protein [Dehalococcoidia bacterium]